MSTKTPRRRAQGSRGGVASDWPANLMQVNKHPWRVKAMWGIAACENPTASIFLAIFDFRLDRKIPQGVLFGYK